ncbi:MAG TPA: oxidoreductase [Tepidisphaeraceae bacterium]|nr:oxidoreductase [Tepidisphaeraceae bacterium]
MRLKDKVILITGSTNGIGAAIARRCVAEGASVVLHGREAEAGRKMLAELGDRARLHLDKLEDPAAATRLVEVARKNFGRLDGLVNNAAWSARSNLSNTTAELFDQIMAINARAPMLLVQQALPMLKASQGSIVNIGSINAYTGEPNLIAYSMSKGALMTLSRNLADSLCYDKVRVNHMNVGWVLTDNEIKIKIDEGLAPDWYKHIPRQYAPSGEIMKPETVAGAVIYWLSDESRPISGTVMEFEQYPVIGRNPHKE